MFFYKSLLKWGKNEENPAYSLSPAYFLKLKNIILFLNQGLIFFSKWSYSQRCFDVSQRPENRR